MKALTWQGRRELSVDEVPDPRIEAPTDAIVQITSTAPISKDTYRTQTYIIVCCVFLKT